MPIVTVSHKASAAESVLDDLRLQLPEIVSRALDCPEAPYDGHLRPGDVNLRFVAALEDGLDYLIEVRTSWTRSRSENLQGRTDEVRAALAKLGLTSFGVWIEIPSAAWSQT